MGDKISLNLKINMDIEVLQEGVKVELGKIECKELNETEVKDIAKKITEKLKESTIIRQA